jgi:hypothetical protein
MNKDQVNGRIEETKGTIKEATGKVVGDRTLCPSPSNSGVDANPLE